MVSPSLFTFALDTTYGDGGELGLGWTDVPFDIPNHRAENGSAENHVRIGWLRSVANIYHAFEPEQILEMVDSFFCGEPALD